MTRATIETPDGKTRLLGYPRAVRTHDHFIGVAFDEPGSEPLFFLKNVGSPWSALESVTDHFSKPGDWFLIECTAEGEDPTEIAIPQESTDPCEIVIRAYALGVEDRMRAEAEAKAAAKQGVQQQSQPAVSHAPPQSSQGHQRMSNMMAAMSTIAGQGQAAYQQQRAASKAEAINRLLDALKATLHAMPTSPLVGPTSDPATRGQALHDAIKHVAQLGNPARAPQEAIEMLKHVATSLGYDAHPASLQAAAQKLAHSLTPADIEQAVASVLPPPPEAEESMSAIDEELAKLDDFLNDARREAGGL